MNVLRAFPISRGLPLALLLALALLWSGLAVYRYHAWNEQVQRQGFEQVRVDMARLQAGLERDLAHGDWSRAEQILTWQAVRPPVTALAAVDDTSRVLLATRLAWKGRPATALPHFDPAAFQQARDRGRPLILTGGADDHIHAYYPLTLAAQPGELRPLSQGVLFLEYDLRRDRAALWPELLRESLGFAGATLLVALALMRLLQRRVIQPLRQLTAAARRIEAGNLDGDDGRLPETGELGQLAVAFERMRRQLRRIIEQLLARERHLAITLRSLGDAVIVTDAAGRVQRLNPVAERLTGWPMDEVIDQPASRIFKLVDARTRQPVADPVTQVLQSGELVELGNHITLLARTGQEYQIADNVAPIRDDEGILQGAVLVFRDVTAQYALREALRESEALYRTLVAALADGVVLVDRAGKLVTWNDSARRILGLDADRADGYNLFAEDWGAVREDGSLFPTAEFPAVLALADGQPRQGVVMGVRGGGDTTCWLLINAQPLFKPDHPQPHAVVVSFTDISARREAEERIRYLVLHDALTSLPNRRQFYSRLERAFAVARRENSHGALLLVDLDHFKAVNDAFGHDGGDELLIQMARILQAMAPPGASVARLGGDDFAVVLQRLGPDETQAALRAERAAKRILAAADRSFPLKGRDCPSSASVGIALFRDHRERPEAFLKRAEAAMYAAKSAGRNTLRFFDPALAATLAGRVALRHDLQQALAGGEQLLLCCQPQLNAERQLIGGELLLHWQHPRRGVVASDDFIPLAEESNLIVALGQWVIESACQQLARWERTGLLTSDLTLAVNVSPRQFLEPNFVARVKAALCQSGCDPRRLKLEITEGLLIKRMDEAAVIMRRLKTLGIGFSLDDFGTGYSSLAYLRRLPLDQIKIDRCFVRDLVENPDDAVLVETIIVMGRQLRLQVLAEGVETEAQYAFLNARGCNQFQGYLFGPALPLEEFERLLAADVRLKLVKSL
jgi:diguanylate cyclase (GGDEF)-like protein/PAS domain S-box-containing protein